MIELNEAAYGYGSNVLLSEMNLSLSQGSFHFLTGPSGAGKTTLLKLCYADLLATEGTVTIFGKNSAEMGRDDIAQARQRMGVVHQDCEFLDHLSLMENVALPLTVAGHAEGAKDNDLTELMGWVGLSDRKDALPPELSGGERQRAALARAVITDPDVIVADEPTGNIDWDMSLRLLQLLVELNRMGKTILVATHDMALIRAAKAQIFARVLRIADGKLQAAGTDL